MEGRSVKKGGAHEGSSVKRSSPIRATTIPKILVVGQKAQNTTLGEGGWKTTAEKTAK